LSDDEKHYLQRVLRLDHGDKVEVVDGSGRLFAGVLGEDDVHQLSVVYEEPLPAARIVFAALIKGNRWDTLLEKVAEIGATKIVPIEAKRSVVTIKSSKVEKKLDRWQKVLDGAARQCERLSRPTVAAPASLADALEAYDAERTLLLDEVETGAPWPRWESEVTVRLGIGPEGGWTEEERETWREHGAESVGLGANLLRAETAAMAAMMMVRAIDYGMFPE
jgi:16S rRNA (uracil1498-N3)-methyltransferase